MPDKVQQVQGSSTSHNELEVRWKEPDTYNLPLLLYEVQCRVSKVGLSSKWSSAIVVSPKDGEMDVEPGPVCTIRDLDHREKYQVRVRAKTESGFGKYSLPSEAFSVQRLELAIPDQVRKLANVLICLF